MRKPAILLLLFALLFSVTATAQQPVPTNGLRFWLRASDITGVSDGQPISTWPDNSGNSRPATSTGTFRPTLRANAINGLPAVRFNGNGGLTKDQPLMTVNDSTQATVTAFVVLAHQRDPLLTSGDGVDMVIATKNDFPARGFGFSSYNTFANRSNREIRREGGSNEGADGGFAIRRNGFAVSPTLNLGEFTIITYEAFDLQNTRGSGRPFVIGANRDSTRAGRNDIAEILIYNRRLSSDERAQVESYLSGRYNIPLIPLFNAAPVTQIPSSGIQLWLRADEISQSGFNRGDAVPFWLDASGNRRNAVSNGGARPTLVPSSVNNFAALRFDGTDDTMGVALPTSGAITAFAVFANQRATLSAVSRETVIGATADTAASATGFALLAATGGTRTLAGAPTGGAAPTLRRNGATALALTQGQFSIATYSGTVTNAGGSGARLRLGALLNGTGAGQNDIAEVIIYNRALSTAEIDQVERYLSLKFSISVPSNTAPSRLELDNFSVSDTNRNGWTVPPPLFGVFTRDRHTLAWTTDQGAPALRIGVSGNIGVNGLPQGLRPLPGGARDTLGGGGDPIWKTFKSSATDTTPVNLSRAKVLHVFARTTTENLNAFNRDIAPTMQIILRDASRPPYINAPGDTGRQFRVTNGGRRFSNEIPRQATLIADGKYHEYIFDFTNEFRGLDFGNVFGFGANATYSVDSTRIDQLILNINPGLITGMTFRHNFDDPDRVVRVVGNRGSDQVGGDFAPVYTTSAPRFRGEIFIRSIIADESPFPLAARAFTANPTVAAREAGEGYYVLGATGAFVEIARNDTSSGSLSATRGTIATVDTIRIGTGVIDTVGYNNIYRINDGDPATHVVIPGRIWTINQTGLGARARFDISLDVAGLTNILRPQNLYIARRNNATSPWIALSTMRSGNFLKAFNLTREELGQFGIGTKLDRNPVAGLLNTPINLGGKPEEFRLAQNYPNPFNPATNISYTLPSAQTVTLKVYDLLGREVATLVNGRQSAGNYVVQFNASSLASGVYFYRLQAGSFAETRKMMLLK